MRPGGFQREEAPDVGLVRGPVVPIRLDRLHPRTEPDLVGVAVLQHQALDSFGVTGGDPESDRRAEVEHVQAEGLDALRLDEVVDCVREPIEGRAPGKRGAPTEPGIVGRDHVNAAGEPSHKLVVLS